MSSKKLDTLFKKALHGKTSEPPPHIWKNIEQQVYQKRNKRKIVAWWYSCAAMITLLLCLPLLLQLRHEQEDKQLFITPIKTNLPEIAANMSVRPVIPTERKPYFIPETTEKNDRVIREVDLPVGTYKINNNNVILHTRHNEYKKIESIRKDFIPLINKNAIANNITYQKLLTDRNSLPSDAPEKMNDKISLSLSGHFAPGYASGNYSSSIKNSRGTGYSKDQMSGVASLSGGLKISISSTKRLAFQTGIFYTRMGQRTEESNIYIPRTTVLNAVTPQKSNLQGALGKIKGNNYTNAALYRTEGIVGLATANSGNGEIEQLFGALEIPLTVKYRLNDNKVKFSVLGGVSGSFIVDNQSYLNYDNQRESLGGTEDIRNFNISTDFGLGVEYPITSKIRFMVEPGFRYYLQSISKDANINFKPYSFSFSTGIGIDF